MVLGSGPRIRKNVSGMLGGISLIHADLEHPPSSSSHEVSKHSCVFINDNMVAVIHCTALGVDFKSWNIWNITRAQRSELYPFEHVHVCGMADVLPAILNNIIQALNSAHE